MAIGGPLGGETRRKKQAEWCAALGPEEEVTGLAFLIKPMWKDEGLNEKYNYSLPLDCDSGGFEPLPAPSKVPRQRRF